MGDSFWSLLGNVAGIIGGVLQYKVIAALVPADQYGRAALVLGVLALLNMFLVNPLATAQLRLFFDYAQKGMAVQYQRRFRVLLYVVSGVCVLGYVVFALLARDGGNHVYWGLALPAVLVLISTPQATATSNFLELKRQYRDLSMATLVGRLSLLGILVLLLWTALPRATAIVLTNALAPLLVIQCFERRARVGQSIEAAGRNHRIPWLSMVGAGFAGALYLSNFMMWCITTSDRYVIGHYLPLHDVGVYTMNYGLWSVPYLALVGWLDLTVRARFYARAASGDWAGAKRMTLVRLAFAFGVSVVGTAALYVIGPLVARWFLGPGYAASTSLMMTLAIAHVFYVAANSVMPVFLAAKKAGYIVASNTVAAGVNIVLNIWLVPKYGIYAAAANTLVAYVVLTVVTMVCAHVILRRLMACSGAVPDGIELTAAAKAAEQT
jgi:O-antigen/teichoic acid export membrane protein